MCVILLLRLSGIQYGLPGYSGLLFFIVGTLFESPFWAASEIISSIAKGPVSPLGPCFYFPVGLAFCFLADCLRNGILRALKSTQSAHQKVGPGQ
jgi:hypothetical protein